MGKGCGEIATRLSVAGSEKLVAEGAGERSRTHGSKKMRMVREMKEMKKIKKMKKMKKTMKMKKRSR